MLIEYIGWREAYYIFAAGVFVVGGVISCFLVSPEEKENCDEDSYGYKQLDNTESMTSFGKAVMLLLWFLVCLIVMVAAMIPLITMVSNALLLFLYIKNIILILYYKDKY